MKHSLLLLPLLLLLGCGSGDPADDNAADPANEPDPLCCPSSTGPCTCTVFWAGGECPGSQVTSCNDYCCWNNIQVDTGDFSSCQCVGTVGTQTCPEIVDSFPSAGLRKEQVPSCELQWVP